MGPLVFGSLWNGVSSAVAVADFWGGALSFILIHGKIISGLCLVGMSFEAFGRWFDFYAGNPYSAAAMGGALSIALCFFVSKFTKPLSDEYMLKVACQ